MRFGFAEMLRRSALVRVYDPAVPQVLACAAPASLECSGGSGVPLHGLKHDPPASLFGRALTHVCVAALDGPYGRARLWPASDAASVVAALAALVQPVGGNAGAHTDLPNAEQTFRDPPALNGGMSAHANVPNAVQNLRVPPAPNGRTSAHADLPNAEQAPRVPGRVLGRWALDAGMRAGRGGARVAGRGGWSVGVAGIVAFLPASEVPGVGAVTDADCARRRAFLFRVLRAQFGPDGRPDVVLSLL